MDDALFARRALGGLGARSSTASTSTTTKSTKAARDDRPPPAPAPSGEEGKPEYEPTPEDMLEMMKFLRDTGLSSAEPPPDVPETLEVRCRALTSLPVGLSASAPRPAHAPTPSRSNHTQKIRA